MKLKYIDIHSHLQLPQFDSDREEIIAKMKAEKIGAIVVGVDFESSKKAVALAEQHENLWASIGLHPNDNRDECFDFDAYKKLAQSPKVVAIGECGLDYFRCEETEKEKNRQKKLFEKHISLGRDVNLPLMLHIRDAYADAIDVLSQYKKEYGEKLRGNIHFFAGGMNEAKRFFDLGFSVSFTGVITFTDDYNAVIESAPLDMIMVETDSPFVSPARYRGKRCEPIYVTEVVDKISKLLKKDKEELAKHLLHNTQEKFALGKQGF